MPPTLRQSIINTVDDSSPNSDITTNAYETYCSLLGEGGWDAHGIREGKAKGFEYAWTGIIGMVQLSSKEFALALVDGVSRRLMLCRSLGQFRGRKGNFWRRDLTGTVSSPSIPHQ